MSSDEDEHKVDDATNVIVRPASPSGVSTTISGSSASVADTHLRSAYPTQAQVQQWLRALSYSAHFNDTALEFADYALLVRYSADKSMLRQLFRLPGSGGSGNGLTGDVLSVAIERLHADISMYIDEHGGRDVFTSSSSSSSSFSTVAAKAKLNDLFRKLSSVTMSDMAFDVDARGAMRRIAPMRVVLFMMRGLVAGLLITALVLTIRGEPVMSLADSVTRAQFHHYEITANVESSALAPALAIAIACVVANIYMMGVAAHALLTGQRRDVGLSAVTTDVLLTVLLVAATVPLLADTNATVSGSALRDRAYDKFVELYPSVATPLPLPATAASAVSDPTTTDTAALAAVLNKRITLYWPQSIIDQATVRYSYVTDGRDVDTKLAETDDAVIVILRCMCRSYQSRASMSDALWFGARLTVLDSSSRDLCPDMKRRYTALEYPPNPLPKGAVSAMYTPPASSMKDADEEEDYDYGYDRCAGMLPVLGFAAMPTAKMTTRSGSGDPFATRTDEQRRAAAARVPTLLWRRDADLFTYTTVGLRTRYRSAREVFHRALPVHWNVCTGWFCDDEHDDDSIAAAGRAMFPTHDADTLRGSTFTIAGLVVYMCVSVMTLLGQWFGWFRHRTSRGDAADDDAAASRWIVWTTAGDNFVTRRLLTRFQSRWGLPSKSSSLSSSSSSSVSSVALASTGVGADAVADNEGGGGGGGGGDDADSGALYRLWFLCLPCIRVMCSAASFRGFFAVPRALSLFVAVLGAATLSTLTCETCYHLRAYHPSPAQRAALAASGYSFENGDTKVGGVADVGGGLYVAMVCAWLSIAIDVSMLVYARWCTAAWSRVTLCPVTPTMFAFDVALSTCQFGCSIVGVLAIVRGCSCVNKAAKAGAIMLVVASALRAASVPLLEAAVRVERARVWQDAVFDVAVDCSSGSEGGGGVVGVAGHHLGEGDSDDDSDGDTVGGSSNSKHVIVEAKAHGNYYVAV